MIPSTVSGLGLVWAAYAADAAAAARPCPPPDERAALPRALPLEKTGARSRCAVARKALAARAAPRLSANIASRVSVVKPRRLLHGS